MKRSSNVQTISAQLYFSKKATEATPMPGSRQVPGDSAPPRINPIRQQAQTINVPPTCTAATCPPYGMGVASYNAPYSVEYFS
ncbi:unnamed protein product [Nippostrongylus brasiliensis]|uniref:Uncharacterized protein n=1 Tax=Nippostrongylus brasiliensis TaxID=27835 RepID=A0A0N4XSE1_NIPBR|nr:unnamed protein product [Nippostrongylus brasiliensis]